MWIRRAEALDRARLSAAPVQRPLMEKIAGEIALSDAPGGTLRKSREEIGVTGRTHTSRVQREFPSVALVVLASSRTLENDACKPLSGAWASSRGE